MSWFKNIDALIAPNESRQWKVIPGYEDYYVVSSDGHVVSLERTCQARNVRKVRERILKPTKQFKNGALVSIRVKLSSTDGPMHSTISRLMLISFVGNPCGDEVAHTKDGNPANLLIDNLEWKSFQEIAKAALNGGYAFDENKRGLKREAA